MLADHLTGGCHQRSGGKRRRIGWKMPLQDGGVVVIGHEADLDRFFLLGGRESQSPGIGPGLRLRHLAHRRQHPRHHLPVDAPEEIALVLVWIAAAIEGAVPDDGVMPGSDVVALERIGVGQQVAKLGE
jgi:hypothetical protein